MHKLCSLFFDNQLVISLCNNSTLPKQMRIERDISIIDYA